MRLQNKAGMFYVGYLLSGGVVIGLALSCLDDMPAIIVIFTWFLIFGVAQFGFLRCPHCRKCAIILPSGMVSPFVGTHCRYCGHEY